MSAHFAAFCRQLLKTTLEMTREADPVRFVKAEVTGDIRTGHRRTFWVKVTDSRDPQTGTKFPASTGPGHFRTSDCEVDACCVAAAKVAAIDKHEAKFAPEVA